METARPVTTDIDILPSYFPIPGFGLVPVNAYVLKAQQPVLIDTGLHQDRELFRAALSSVIDPSDLNWIWLTHPDQDHVGALQSLMEDFPKIRLVTTFIGFGMLSLFDPLPPDRVYLLNPGEELDLDDRRLLCMRPPSFDNPATTAIYDTKSRALFSSDCFGALLQSPVDEAFALGPSELRDAQVLWATLDSPWLHKVDEASFAAELDRVRTLDPVMVLGSHLPPARAMLPRLLDNLASVPTAREFVGPNQAALEHMLAQMTQAAAAA